MKLRGKPIAVRQRRYPKEELARRGQELYESGIRQQVEAGNDGKIVAINIETREFEVDACDRLFWESTHLFEVAVIPSKCIDLDIIASGLEGLSIKKYLLSQPEAILECVKLV